MVLQLIALALSLSFSAPAETLSFDHGNVQAQINLTKAPGRDVRAEWVAVIQLASKSGARPIDPNVPPELGLLMESGMAKPHGPGGPLVVSASAWPGVFEVREIYFTMSGEWTLSLKLTFADGRTETQTTSVRVP